MAIDFTGKDGDDIEDIAVETIESFVRFSRAEVELAYYILVRENYREQPLEIAAYKDTAVLDGLGDVLVETNTYAGMPVAMKQASWAVLALVNYFKENGVSGTGDDLSAVTTGNLRLFCACALAVGNLQFQFLDNVLADEADITTGIPYVQDDKSYIQDHPSSYANSVWRQMTDSLFSPVDVTHGA